MNDTLGDLVTAHLNWLGRHFPPNVDDTEWLYHADALMALQEKRAQLAGDPVDELMRSDARTLAEMDAHEAWREAQADLAADQTAAAREELG